MSTKAEQIHDAVIRLMDEGVEKAEAFHRVEAETGLKYDSVRGAFYSHRKAIGQSGGSRSRSRKRETTTEDAVASAVATLRGAIDSIEVELETARERAEEAQAEYQAIQAASGGRIEEIRAKIAILDPEASDQSPQPVTAGSGAKAPTTKAGTSEATPAGARKEVKGS